MKKVIALLLAVCCMASAAAAAGGEGTRFVTVQEWLDAKGECGECMLLLKVETVLNPVLAIGRDETGTVNLYSGNAEETDIIVWFMGEDCAGEGSTMVIANPRYNIYEGTIEMADWTLVRLLPPLGEE